jgi:hypothetical protein
MPVTPNIIHTAKQIVNAQVVASKTTKLRTADITPLQQPANRNRGLPAGPKRRTADFGKALYREAIYDDKFGFFAFPQTESGMRLKRAVVSLLRAKMGEYSAREWTHEVLNTSRPMRDPTAPRC